jgi:hypothetical protein
MHLTKIQLITAAGALGLVLVVLDLVRRRRLSEEYSLLWVISTLSWRSWDSRPRS